MSLIHLSWGQWGNVIIHNLNIPSDNFTVPIRKWLSLNRISEPSLLSINIAYTNLKMSNSSYLLGVQFATDVKWNDYKETVDRSVSRKVGFPSESILNFYKTTIRLCFEYCSHAMSGQVRLMCIWRFLTESIEESTMLLRFSYHSSIASLCLFFKEFHCNISN